MDWLTFTVQIVSAMAWPAVVVMLLFLLRRHFAISYWGNETAIIVDDKFYILKGNHLRALKNKSLGKLMKYWRERPDEWAGTTDLENV